MNFAAYAESLPGTVLDQLYHSSDVCQAILHSLPPLAKQYVVRLLHAGAVPAEWLDQWAIPSAQKKHEAAVDKLTQLQLLKQPASQRGSRSVNNTYTLHSDFQSQLRAAQAGTFSDADQEVTLEVQEAAPTAEQVEQYATSQWEALLLYLISPVAPNKPPHVPPDISWGSLDLDHLLLQAGLISAGHRLLLPTVFNTTMLACSCNHQLTLLKLGSGHTAQLLSNLAQPGKKLTFVEPKAIAEPGFQFLLLDTYSQLWLLLQQYIADAQKKAEEVHDNQLLQKVNRRICWARNGAHMAFTWNELVHVIGFLLQMGFRKVGVPFLLGEMNPLQKAMAAHLAQLGLLFPFRVKGEVWVTPTRLALALTGGTSGEVQQGVAEGYVIVETNYRVYAYTTSELQVAILKLFVRAECRLPNLFVGTLTRESVTQALEFGVQADQIVTFMQQHAHPHVAHKIPVVPEVVSDQIRLWQADMQRVSHQKAVLYDAFPTPQIYQLAARFAQQHGWLLWQNDDQGRFVSQADAHPQMREYIKSIK